MSQPRNNNQNKQYTKDWNNKKRDFRPKKEEHYLDAYKPGIEVWNGDVNKALRILKKRLERFITLPEDGQQMILTLNIFCNYRPMDSAWSVFQIFVT